MELARVPLKDSRRSDVLSLKKTKDERVIQMIFRICALEQHLVL